MKKYLAVMSIVFIVLTIICISIFTTSKIRPAVNKNPKTVVNNNSDTNEPVTKPNTDWTTHSNPVCGISYATPPGWLSEGLALSPDGKITTLSSPDDMLQDKKLNPRMTDAGPAFPSISFYLNCADDVTLIFNGQDISLVQNGSTMEAALAKGLLKNLGDAQYLKTIEVAGQKAFVYEIGATDSRPGMHYDSVFVHLNNKWMEIRPSMTRFVDITKDQQGILDSIQVLDIK